MINEKFIYISEQIDKFITIDVGFRKVIDLLYKSARKITNIPLTLKAADIILTRVDKNSIVFIATGWPDRPHITPNIAESDGPPGAALLALSLHKLLNIIPFIFIEKQLIDSMKYILESTGLKVLDIQQAILSNQSPAPIHSSAILEIPTSIDEAKEYSKMIFKKYKPSCLITIEKGGMNEFNKIHTSRGHDTTEYMGKADFLLDEANSNHIPSICIGDGGNELGMGLIKDEIEELIPFGKKCNCGCGGGIVPIRKCDALITSSISNWGAYGLIATLAAIQKNPDILHSPEEEERVLIRCSDAGFIDGINGYVKPGADGLHYSMHTSFIRLLKDMIYRWIQLDLK